MIEVNVTVTDNHGNTISLAHGDVANLQYLLGNLVKPVGYPIYENIKAVPFHDDDWQGRACDNIEKDKTDYQQQNAEVVQTSEESGDGCAKDHLLDCICNDCNRSYI